MRKPPGLSDASLAVLLRHAAELEPEKRGAFAEHVLGTLSLRCGFHVREVERACVNALRRYQQTGRAA